MLIMDFAENYSCKNQDEVSSTVLISFVWSFVCFNMESHLPVFIRITVREASNPSDDRQ